MAELVVSDVAQSCFPVVIVAPTLPIRPGDRLITLPIRKILDFINVRTPAYFDCGFNLADVRDVAKGNILAAEHGRHGERLLGNENVTLNELLRFLEKNTGLEMPKRVPCWLSSTTGILLEFIADLVPHRSPRALLAGVRLACCPMFIDSQLD